MNGYITGSVFSGRLTQLAAHVQVGTWTEEGITAELNDIRDELVKAVNRTMESAVEEALTEFKPNQKIQLIKRVRELTGSGLKEAKDAVEDALPKILVKEIEDLYRELAQANSRVHWNMTRLPDGSLLNTPNSEERQDDKEAWNDEPPF